MTSIISVLGLVVALIIALVSHRLERNRDRQNDRRKVRVSYLIDAYRVLERASQRRPLPGDRAERLESAIAAVQLLGTIQQVELAQAFAANFARDKSTSLDDLLAELRSELRSELSLGAVSGPPVFLRIEANSES